MPVAIDLVAILTAFLICVVCYMLLVAYRATLGALLQALATGLHNIGVWGVHPFAFLASGASWVDQQINAALAAAVKGTEWALARMLNFTALLIHKSLEAVADLAETTLNAIEHTINHAVPALISAATLPLHRAIESLDHQLGYLWRVVTNLSHDVEHAADKALPKIEITVKKYVEPAVKTATAAVAGTIANPWPRLRSAERALHGIDETLKDTLRKVTPAALAAVFVGSVLERIGMSWLRCRNVRSAGKSICGMNPSALEGLLAGLLTIFGTLSIEAFATELQGVAGVFADSVVAFWRADHPGAGTDRALGAPVAGAAAVALAPDRALGQATSGG